MLSELKAGTIFDTIRQGRVMFWRVSSCPAGIEEIINSPTVFDQLLERQPWGKYLLS
jgi:hypothetical protein